MPFDPFWVAERVKDDRCAPAETVEAVPQQPLSSSAEPSGSAASEAVSRPVARHPLAAPLRRTRRSRPARSAPFERALLSKVRRVATRLNDAGHSAVVDERIGRRPSGARLLVEPRRSPLQPPAESTVLELTIEGSRLAARVWTDVLGDSPEAIHPQPGEDPGLWLDRVLIDFVAGALERG